MDKKGQLRMSIELKRHYLMQVVDCYPKSNRKEKAEIINQFSLVTGMAPKSGDSVNSSIGPRQAGQSSSAPFNEASRA